MDFKNMNDSELAKVMVNYIGRIAHLEDLVGMYLDGADHGSMSAESIKNLYKQLKEELRKDADYLSLARNSLGSPLYMGAFRPSIIEAAYAGFTVPVNRAINQQFFGAVADAHYKLTKYYSLEEWGSLM